MWHLDKKLVRSYFRDEAGVIKFGLEESRYRRSDVSLRVPRSVVERFHNRMVTVSR